MARARTKAPRRARGREPRSLRAVSLGLLALVALAIGLLVLLVIVYPARPASGDGDDVSITIARGEPFDQVVARLGAVGVIESPFLFAIYARLVGADEHLRTGEVVVTDDMTPRQIVQRIAIGFGAATVEVLVPEGFHRFDVAARLARWGVCDQDAFLAITRDRALLDELAIPGPTAEGYLFPDTYRLRTDMEPAEVVRRMVANFRRRTEPVLTEHGEGLARLHTDLGWSAHEALVLASIVEEEAVARDEQPIIARVFLNRLRDPAFRPHRLDADPTVSYGCLELPLAAPSCAAFRGRISRAMTHDAANPYNTYRREMLPPGPITNPGLAALRAVLAPADHEYYFFVARGGGRHTFSRTSDDHVRAVTQARERAEAQREAPR